MRTLRLPDPQTFLDWVDCRSMGEGLMSLAMTKQEREAFLADVHVGVISIPEPGRGPLTVPVWYVYDPGAELRVVTGRTSRKGQLLARSARLSLCVQTETAPYKYVSVEGPIVAIEGADVERDLRPLAHRYLGPPAGDKYFETARSEHEDNVLVRMRPDRWLTVDFAKE
jgi:nitroimidazol reductase NimA-like FMN-containing flavoprotein (pyridoxamine 5'-phosphate oxidase superfamily)